MTANTPPKPHTEGMEWTNTETGIKYQFSGGAWRAVSTQAIEDIIDLIENAADIFYGDSPPTDEKYDLWFDTKRTELCVKHEDMWMPASIGGAGNGDNGVVPTLEQVLQAGPFADIPIVLTDKEEAFIDIDPRENRVLIAGTDNGDPLLSKPPRISLIHITSDSDGQGRADIELDEGGKRLDFEMFSGVDNIHFRFEEDEKFILNKEGDAEFIGNVKAAPATEPDELATFGQLLTVEQEIEQIQRSTDRGRWSFDNTDFIKEDPTFSLIEKILTPADKEANCDEQHASCMLGASSPEDEQQCADQRDACLAAYGDGDTIETTDYWEECTKLVVSYFSDTSANIGGPMVSIHSFKDVEPGMFVDIFNVADGSYGTYKVTAKTPGTNTDPDVEDFSVLSMVFDVEFIKGRGEPSGAATFKFYEQVPVVEQGDVDALLALDVFQESYSAEYVLTMSSAGVTSDSGEVYLGIKERGEQNEAGEFIVFYKTDRFGNKHNWIAPDPDPVITDGVTHLRFFQPSTGAVLIGLVASTMSVWRPEYINTYFSDYVWLVNRGEFVNGEVVVISAGKYIKPKNKAEQIPLAPKYFEWTERDSDADGLPSGYIAGPKTIGTSSTIWLTIPDYYGNGMHRSGSNRIWGWGSTLTIFKLDGNSLQMSLSAQIKTIRRAANTDILEITFDHVTQINYMTTSSLYRVEIAGFN